MKLKEICVWKYSVARNKKYDITAFLSFLFPYTGNCRRRKVSTSLQKNCTRYGRLFETTSQTVWFLLVKVKYCICHQISQFVHYVNTFSGIDSTHESILNTIVYVIYSVLTGDMICQTEVPFCACWLTGRTFTAVAGINVHCEKSVCSKQRSHRSVCLFITIAHFHKPCMSISCSFLNFTISGSIWCGCV